MGCCRLSSGSLSSSGELAESSTLEDGRKAAATATLNGLSAAKALLGSLDRVTAIAKLGVYIATEGDFRDHAKVADGASELLEEVFGTEKLSPRIVLRCRELAARRPDRSGARFRSRRRHISLSCFTKRTVSRRSIAEKALSDLDGDSRSELDL